MKFDIKNMRCNILNCDNFWHCNRCPLNNKIDNFNILNAEDIRILKCFPMPLTVTQLKIIEKILYDQKEEIIGEIEKMNNFRYAKIDIGDKRCCVKTFNSAMEQSACKIDSLINHLTNNKNI